MATRRGFLAGLASLSMPGLVWADVGSPAWLAAGKEGEEFVLHGLDRSGASLFAIPLPARGHAAAAHPSRPEAVAFARRPGVFALVIDCFTGSVLHRLTPPEGRQFNGHGAFSADGSLLMTSEVVADGSLGRLGLWDARDYRRIGEWESGGIGPHDMKRLSDGRLVIANGGIRTDPADRSMLNLDTMQPNLTLLSPEGEILTQITLDPDLHQNSIRHLALIETAERQQVAFAMQWQGDPAEPVAQLGIWTLGEDGPLLCDPAPEDMFAMKGYAGSIAANAGMVGITSPVGGVVMLFAGDGRPLVTHRRADVCGLAPLGAGFVASDGNGGILSVDQDGMRPLQSTATAWDNHMVPVG